MLQVTPKLLLSVTQTCVVHSVPVQPGFSKAMNRPLAPKAMSGWGEKPEFSLPPVTLKAEAEMYDWVKRTLAELR